MNIYRFRILYENENDFYRDIEIASNQTFEDFHHAILQAIEFDGRELASFYTCDEEWNKEQEITLLDMSEEEHKLNIMSESVIADFINTPNQKLIYSYDFLNLCTFYIHLVKLVPADKNTTYPRCVNSKGTITKEESMEDIPSDILFDLEDFIN